MQVKDIMTTDPACCTPSAKLQEVARLMVENDCGEIPVVDDLESCLPVGVITDRDISCRTVAQGRNPLEMTVGDCMTSPLVSVKPQNSLDQCYKVMEDKRIRRVPVVNDEGRCVGIVALADIALNAAKAESAEVLKDVSAASAAASSV